MPTLNQKKLADAVTDVEGKKVSIDRAQVGEAQGWILDALAVEVVEGSPSSVLAALEKRYTALIDQPKRLQQAQGIAEHATNR